MVKVRCYIIFGWDILSEKWYLYLSFYKKKYKKKGLSYFSYIMLQILMENLLYLHSNLII